MKNLLILSLFIFFTNTFADRIFLQNSTEFDKVIYFTFPWYQNFQGKYFYVQPEHLFYNFTVRNNQSDTFVVVTPFVDWNRVCQHDCHLSKNVSYMDYLLWGVYLKSTEYSYLNYTIILDYGFKYPPPRPKFHDDDPLLPLWICLAVFIPIIMGIGFCFLHYWYKMRKEEKAKNKEEKEERDKLLSNTQSVGNCYVGVPPNVV